jgi:hypothetical protein
MCSESTSNPADGGGNSDNAQYSSTPKLHHSAWPDSRTTTRTRTKRLTSATFWARLLGTANPGLKPWAESYWPFGAETAYSQDPLKLTLMGLRPRLS